MVNRNRSPSYFVSFECSVVGRGGSRTALTGAIIMEQAGSTVGRGLPALFTGCYIIVAKGVQTPPLQNLSFGFIIFYTFLTKQ